MAFKLFVLAAALAVAKAGYLGAPAVATYAAPAVSYASPAVSYAAPAVATYAAPAVATYAAPAVSYAAPAVSYAAPAVSYAAPAVSYAAPAVGTSHQSTVRTLDGNSAISHYSKAVDSPFSSVRKVDTRVTNDAQALAYAPAYAPAVTAYHGLGYSAAPVVSHQSFDGYGVHYGY